MSATFEKADDTVLVAPEDQHWKKLDALIAPLDPALETVLAHLLSDLSRAGGELSDADVAAVRIRWAAGSSGGGTVLWARLEASAHGGLLSKRRPEDGGGYRFAWPAAAKYLIYRHLARSRPAGEDEGIYWARRAAAPTVFPEYAGAFTFLLRAWATLGRLALAGPLVEMAGPWLDGILTGFLVDEARAGLPGQANPVAAAAARALAETGRDRTADALDEAGYQLMETPFASTATAYFQACVSIREGLWAAHPGDADVGDRLARALSNLGFLLRDAGRGGEAEQAFARAVEINKGL